QKRRSSLWCFGHTQTGILSRAKDRKAMVPMRYLADTLPLALGDQLFDFFGSPWQAGFNWQSGPWVMGIEGDAQQSQQRGQATTFNCAGAICNPAASAFGLDAPVTASMALRLERFRTLGASLGRTHTPDLMV